jgi:hypothetical protein
MTIRRHNFTCSLVPSFYRGIKIAPMSGKRSATAKAIRDALRIKSEQTTRGKPARV